MHHNELMSNVDAKPQTVVCGDHAHCDFEIIRPRDVPLGGLRAMNVRRTLPSRERSLIGAWCFADHYGPDVVAETGGMTVAPHPHIGLQTVSWLFQGEIEHRDSAGNHAMVVPRQLNLMTSGRGISHSEVSTGSVSMLHGLQLWVALPSDARDTPPDFAHYVPGRVAGDGYDAWVFLGKLLGDESPVETFTPLVGAEIVLEPSSSVTLELDDTFEHGLLIDEGDVRVEISDTVSFALTKDELGYVPTGSRTIRLTSEAGARMVLLGGTPFGEPVMMWWNFLARSQDEIERARHEWQRQITRGTGGVVADSQDVLPGQFGTVVGDHLPPIPAPDLPDSIRLRSRT